MKNVNSIIKKWQQKLGLYNWKINFQFVNQFKRKDNYPQTGDIKVDAKNTQAIILVLKTAKNVEKIVVHELVHLLLWNWDHKLEKSLKDKQERDRHLELLEKTVENLTKILIKTNSTQKKSNPLTSTRGVEVGDRKK